MQIEGEKQFVETDKEKKQLHKETINEDTKHEQSKY